ncbi:hypothetical protein CYMTET_38502 [Cymbomonas tetramitiformis]|uniref:Uncharacterized protein n=1 Tax=Cymbomonas tetramitiformis TaxID=36881 RepID=A0AAE0F4W0_9CHLO|nr:hypothetical protein CYMTET_38502 [Cymbomonas tetramitiformis]
MPPSRDDNKCVVFQNNITSEAREELIEEDKAAMGTSEIGTWLVEPTTSAEEQHGANSLHLYITHPLRTSFPESTKMGYGLEGGELPSTDCVSMLAMKIGGRVGDALRFEEGSDMQERVIFEGGSDPDLTMTTHGESEEIEGASQDTTEGTLRDETKATRRWKEKHVEIRMRLAVTLKEKQKEKETPFSGVLCL